MAATSSRRPERNWDDIKGVDLKGKIILCEVNEPGNAPGGLSTARTMTYYGRWTYKLEKAAELGAAGVFIIHNDKGAAYGWNVVKTSWSQELVSSFRTRRRLSSVEGWLSAAAADSVFAAAKADHAALLAAAGTPGFSPVPLGLTAKVRQSPSYRTVTARNVAGLIRGKAKGAADRYVVVTAHHDHLGRDAPALPAIRSSTGPWTTARRRRRCSPWPPTMPSGPGRSRSTWCSPGSAPRSTGSSDRNISPGTFLSRPRPSWPTSISR